MISWLNHPLPLCKRLPLWVVLSIPVVLQIIIAIGLVGYSYSNGQRTVDDLAHQLIQEVSGRVEQHLQTYTRLPQQIVQLVADDVELGQVEFSAEDLQPQDAYFLRRIQTFPQVSFIYVGNQEGKFLGAGSLETQRSVDYIVEVADPTTQGYSVSYLTDSAGQRTQRLNAVLNYDPRQRPWYRAAMAAEKAAWSEIYAVVGAVNQGLTITAVKPFQTDGSVTGVAAVDLYLDDINIFLKNLQVARTGQVFILEPNGLLVASSSDQKNYLIAKHQSKQLQRLDARFSSDPLIRSTVEQIVQQTGRLNQLHSQQQLEFQHNGQRHFAQAVPWQDRWGLNWTIVTVVPEADFMAQVHLHTRSTLLLCSIAMVVALLISILTARWVITPIQRLNRAAKGLAQGNWEKRIALDRGDEIGELAKSFNQMATQLQLSFSSLHHSQQQFAEFLEAVPVGICVIESSGRFSYMNQTAQTLMALTFDQTTLLTTVMDHCPAYVTGTHRLYPIEHLPAVRALRGETVTATDIEIRREDQVIPLEVRATPIWDAAGQVRCAIVAFQDIHHRKQAEKLLADYNQTLAAQIAERTAEITQTNLELELAKQSAETANAAKSAFLTNMSHELRTPLNAILGFAQVMVLDPNTTLEQQRSLDIINRSGAHLLSLINNILDLSKIEAGRVELVESYFNLNELLETLDQILRQQAETKGLQFQIIRAIDVPQLIIGDANKLRQVLINLISNAIKFTNYGSVALRVNRQEIHSLSFDQQTKLLKITSQKHKTEYSALKLEELVFEVQDTGIGIASSELDKVFDAFEQSNHARISAEGTGLGLTISHKFVELMGGTIAVHSVPMVGSTFTIQLPVCCPTHNQVLPPPTSCVVLGLAPGQPRYRVLIVDDQPENRELLVRILDPLRLEVEECSAGEAAVACWQQWQPHLILLDLYMPNVSGFAVAEQIRQLESHKLESCDLESCELELYSNSLNVEISRTKPSPSRPTKIVALSASVLEDDRRRAAAAGCNGFLGKPFQSHALYEVMAQQLALSYRYAKPRPTMTTPVAVHSDLAELPSGAALQPLLKSASFPDFMPADWCQQFYEATICCRDEQVIDLLKQIPPEHSALSRQIYTYAQKFQFDMILPLLHGYSKKDEDRL